MKEVYIDGMNIISALGLTAEENYNAVRAGKTGVQPHEKTLLDTGIAYVSLLPEGNFSTDQYTKYENLLIASVKDAVSGSDIDPSSGDTLFVFSSTKGNNSSLDNTTNADELSLFTSAEKVCGYFNNTNKPVVISNACISGVVALIYGRRMIESGKFKNVIVTGADVINKFIYSGFLSFLALSPENCKPFSADRDGINLGDAAATIILTSNKKTSHPIMLMGGSITNDANHISCPSRTGEELSAAINKAMNLSEVKVEDIGFVSAHGTATLFNDEMEAKAFTLSGLKNVPVHSLKGYFGHTLGAAGLVESVIGITGLKKGEIIPTLGYTGSSVEPGLLITNELTENKSMNYFLKTASGFGGCNAAVVFSKS